MDAIGAAAEAVIKAWLWEVDFRLPRFVAAWQLPDRAVFLLSGHAPPLWEFGPVTEPGGVRVVFAREPVWGNGRLGWGWEPLVSATVANPPRPRQQPSRFVQADGVLVPVGATAWGLLYLPLCGPALGTSGKQAPELALAMVTRGLLRLGRGAARLLVDPSLTSAFATAGAVEVETLPATAQHLPQPDLDGILRARDDTFIDKRAFGFREHALISRGAHLPLLIYVLDRRRTSRVPVTAHDATEAGAATLIIGEAAGRRGLSGSAGDAFAQPGLRMRTLGLRSFLLTPQEQRHAAFLLAAAPEPAPATGLAPAIEQVGFIGFLSSAPKPIPGTPARPRPQLQAVPARRIRCLGSLRIEVDGHPARPRLREPARQLAALLVAHPHGVPRELAIETLWPTAEDTPGDPKRPKKNAANFRQTLRNLRLHLGGKETVLREGDRVRLNLDRVWTDVAAFQHAIDQARATSSPNEQAAHLQQAVTLYAGRFCNDDTYNWLQPHAQVLQERFLQVAVTLAGIRSQQDDPDAALAVLDKALVADPYAEHLYRQAMKLEDQRGRRDQVIRRYQRLCALLADLADPDHQRPMTPSTKTTEVYTNLTST